MTTKPNRRGRPSREQAQEKNTHLLVLAQQSFLAHGFAATTIDHIASISGISKSTIYARYGGKEGLFRAVTRRSCQAPQQALSMVPTQGRAPRDVLADFIAVLLGQARDPDGLALLRLVIFESQRFPDVAASVFRESLETLAPLRNYLHELQRHGQLGDCDPEAAALDLVNLCTGGYRFLLLGHDEEPREQTHERLLALFLRGMGIEDARTRQGDVIASRGQ
ncbi:TetR/AcrR family transcriptional regulator [Pseudomonas sp. B392_1p]|uniref:TetR/AcrR family transcriptional regulator n=1 Tax=Pseudomonas sp. B392_1p TaxID=3457507 RepID=UPI003FD409F2